VSTLRIKVTEPSGLRRSTRASVFVAPLRWSVLGAGFCASLGLWLGAAVPSAVAADTIAFAGAIASVSGGLLGFMLAALAVVASISGTHLLAMMRKTGHYRSLLATLFLGAAWLLVCLLLSLALLFGWQPTPLITVAFTSVLGAVLAMLLDTGRKFWLVLTNLAPLDPPP
jgi:hypothetical protein